MVASSRQVTSEKLEEKYLLGKTTTGSLHIVSSIITLIISIPLILLPAGIVYSCNDFITYDLLNVKIPGLNYWMEFIRYSIFAAVMFASFLFLEIAVAIMPAAIVKIVEIGQGRTSLTARRRLHYARDSKKWIIMTLFFVVLAIVSANLLYDSSFIVNLKATLKSSKTPATSLSERLFIIATVFAFSMAAAKYAIAAVSYNFYFTGFAHRIDSSNYRFEILEQLYLCLNRGLPTKRNSHKMYSTKVELLQDQHMDLSCVQKAQEVANDIFEKITNGRETLAKEDLRPYFDSTKIDNAFHVFDPNNSGSLTSKQFEESVYLIFEERHYISKSIACHAKILRKLDMVLFFIALTIAVLFSFSVFELKKASISIVFVAVYGAVIYLNQEGLRALYQSVNFIFTVHPFDVGDRVSINGMDPSMTVEKIDLLSTVFTKWDGTLAYIPNQVLAQGKIYNWRRSTNSSLIITSIIPTKTPMEKIWKLRDLLQEWTRSKPADYTGQTDLSSLNLVSSTETQIEFIIKFAGNFQNEAKRAARMKACQTEIDRIRKVLLIDDASPLTEEDKQKDEE